ncbi:glycoside hydrolase family 3 protein [Demequina flava]|uniref:glycoside hydrolase family 3 protein n=1 Tax=Demequina flava TaxID=1095025 RepID=UPI0007828125|nr:glycoside hydrolase family 3 N-terminal domain-containing protein [Demequina flava]
MNPLSVLMPGFLGTELPEWVERRLRQGMGGVCLFGTNVSSPEQLRALTDRIYAANPRAVVAIDEEGGDVSRLYQREGSPYPGCAVLGRLDDLGATRAVGAQVGWELREAGVNLTLAPEADVNSNAHNPVIGVRAFGDTPDLVGRHAAAWTDGVQSTGVAATAKHFPGHGDTSLDSHHDLPRVTASADVLRERELPPFIASIDAGVASIMSAHIVVPALDPDNAGTFSAPILTGLLREELGFEGVVVSDALNMAGAQAYGGTTGASVKALAAGVDLLCVGYGNTDDEIDEIVEAIEAAIATGDLTEARLREASTRIGTMVAEFSHRAETTPVPEAYRHAVVPGVDAARVRDAFAINDHASTVLAGRSGVQRIQWVKLEPAHNMAVGESPWGPFASGVRADAVVTPDEPLTDFTPAADAVVVVVGKDNHRHAWARDAIDELRTHGAVAVDMGWPDLTDNYADIATFGASRLVGEALKEVLA